MTSFPPHFPSQSREETRKAFKQEEMDDLAVGEAIFFDDEIMGLDANEQNRDLDIRTLSRIHDDEEVQFMYDALGTEAYYDGEPNEENNPMLPFYCCTTLAFGHNLRERFKIMA